MAKASVKYVFSALFLAALIFLWWSLAWLCSDAYGQTLPPLPELELPDPVELNMPAEGDCPDTILYAAVDERIPKWLREPGSDRWRCAAYITTPTRYRWLVIRAEREETYRDLLKRMYEARISERSLTQRHIDTEVARADRWMESWQEMVEEVSRTGTREGRRAYWRAAPMWLTVGAAGGIAMTLLVIN